MLGGLTRRRDYALDTGTDVNVEASPQLLTGPDAVTIWVSGHSNSGFRVRVTSPNGSWAIGHFETDAGGSAIVTLASWLDRGTWMIEVDFTTPEGFDISFTTFGMN